MTTGEYLVSREPRNESERVLVEGEVRSDLAKITVNIEVTADTEYGLIKALRAKIADREIPPEECVGAQGFSAAFEADFPKWKFEPRLGPMVAVIWHPNTIIPPCTVLQDEAVIYGAVEKA